MTHVVLESCIRCKYTDCVDVCPVDCFREGPNMLVIDPDECIDCAVCIPECPVNAILPEEDVPNDQLAFLKLNAELSALANEVKAVKHGTKSNPWQIDAIAGATVTSRAVGKAINDSAQLLLPKLLPQIEQLRKKES